MIDDIILTVGDFERSVAFYAKALKPLGITNFTDYKGPDGHPDLKGFGDGERAFFWLKEGKPYPQAVHVGFVAKDHASSCGRRRQEQRSTSNSARILSRLLRDMGARS
jgi:hypothetical protein